MVGRDTENGGITLLYKILDNINHLRAKSVNHIGLKGNKKLTNIVL